MAASGSRPFEEIGEQLAVAEGIETALSVIADHKAADSRGAQCSRYAVAAMASPGSAAVDRGRQ